VAGTPLLQLRDLSVHYRQRRTTLRAVDGITFDVMSRETLGLVGESGSGKSTIARAILGLVPIHAGSVHFASRDITALRFKERREIYRDIQIVFQDPYSSLNPSRTIGRTLAEPLQAFGVRDRGVVREQVRAMLARVHLPSEAADRYPRQFSGGQRQRIAIARALMLSPRLVVFDEPTSALDLSVQAQILNLLRELQATSGLSYLFISHDLEVVRYLSDRVVVLYQGQVMESGPTIRVADAPAHPYTDALHQAVPLPNPRLQRERHAFPKPERPTAAVAVGEGCPFVPRCPHSEARCWAKRPALQPSSHGLVACHRYPEWQAELRSGANRFKEGVAPRIALGRKARKGQPTGSLRLPRRVQTGGKP
jgi:peptide/nickel transport system ATP-binding protein